jgi:DNA invertase Pin-like site-specific DNA recombinase
MNGGFVAYYRVSTQKQSNSGLGLEAQQKAVLDYLNGGRLKLVGAFTEIESGKHNDRPALAEAIKACRVHKATLIVAKLDRLARNVAFISSLMESGVEFAAVDFPQANRLTVHILAAVAEHEAKMISKRTKAALAGGKARSVKLGGNRGVGFDPQVRIAGNKARTARANARATNLATALEKIRADGATSLRDIAAALNEQEVPAPRGGQWSAVQVQRLLARL